MKNIISKNNRISLTGKLMQSILIALLAMAVVWFVFYVNTNAIINRYVNRNMDQVSMQIISKLEESFLQMEELSYALTASKETKEFITSESAVEFVAKAENISELISHYQKSDELMEHIVIFTPEGLFYRFEGGLGNVSVKRIMQITEDYDRDASLRLTLENREYIGYVSIIRDNGRKLGTMVILAEENTLYRVFENATQNDDMHISLAAEDEIIISKEKAYLGKNVETLKNNTDYCSFEKIGFTPFELVITYENAGKEVKGWFIFSMISLAVFLLIILMIFIMFWRKRFFKPISQIISNVEKIGEGNSEKIEETGLEHFDGLVCGINDMIERVEQKEKEIYEVNTSLKEAELRKQKAFIVSLKKQISAHFTVNVLAVIKALAATGENEKAGNLCDGLSYLLRYANAGDSYIDGMGEFSILQRYADIMKIRFPGRFEVDIEYDDELENIQLPRMLLQPVIENSIVHGLAGNDEMGIIRIYGEISEDVVRFFVEDNGKGMSKEELCMLQEKIDRADEEEEIEGLSHVALCNIQRRLVSYYGKGYGISIESMVNKGTKVTVSIPR